MRDDRAATSNRLNSLLVIGLVGLAAWLVIQNLALLLMVASPLMPAAATVGRALLKVTLTLAAPLAPFALMVAGTLILWSAAHRTSSREARRLEEVNHG